MFKLGFTGEDLKRAVWTFVQAGLAAAIVVLTTQDQLPQDWTGAKQLGIAAGLAFVAAVISALKNFLLADSSSLK